MNCKQIIELFDNTIFHSYEEATKASNGKVKCIVTKFVIEPKSMPLDNLSLFNSDTFKVHDVKLTYVLLIIKSGEDFIYIWVKE